MAGRQAAAMSRQPWPSLWRLCQHDALLELLCGAPDYDQTRGPNTERWLKKTCDSGGAVKIQVPEAWGLTGPVLKQLATHPAVLEIQSRLAALYPEYGNLTSTS